mmetsp:Transcript_9846/g.15137  ORF Transcript_9846/g.15137 Transcript_9846/m.15137 type:complete len:778 (+) Transcript_9846:2399-4732(+)
MLRRGKPIRSVVVPGPLIAPDDRFVLREVGHGVVPMQRDPTLIGIDEGGHVRGVCAVAKDKGGPARLGLGIELWVPLPLSEVREGGKHDHTSLNDVVNCGVGHLQDPLRHLDGTVAPEGRHIPAWAQHEELLMLWGGHAVDAVVVHSGDLSESFLGERNPTEIKLTEVDHRVEALERQVLRVLVDQHRRSVEWGSVRHHKPGPVGIRLSQKPLAVLQPHRQCLFAGQEHQAVLHDVKAVRLHVLQFIVGHRKTAETPEGRHVFVRGFGKHVPIIRCAEEVHCILMHGAEPLGPFNGLVAREVRHGVVALESNREIRRLVDQDFGVGEFAIAHLEIRPVLVSLGQIAFALLDPFLKCLFGGEEHEPRVGHRKDLRFDVLQGVAGQGVGAVAPERRDVLRRGLREDVPRPRRCEVVNGVVVHGRERRAPWHRLRLREEGHGIVALEGHALVVLVDQERRLKRVAVALHEAGPLGLSGGGGEGRVVLPRSKRLEGPEEKQLPFDDVEETGLDRLQSPLRGGVGAVSPEGRQVFGRAFEEQPPVHRRSEVVDGALVQHATVRFAFNRAVLAEERHRIVAVEGDAVIVLVDHHLCDGDTAVDQDQTGPVLLRPLVRPRVVLLPLHERSLRREHTQAPADHIKTEGIGLLQCVQRRPVRTIPSEGWGISGRGICEEVAILFGGEPVNDVLMDCSVLWVPNHGLVLLEIGHSIVPLKRQVLLCLVDEHLRHRGGPTARHEPRPVHVSAGNKAAGAALPRGQGFFVVEEHETPRHNVETGWVDVL